MPQGRRPARAIAIAIVAEERRRRLLLVGINCALAASFLAGLALVVL